jgi:glyoxylase-like metal-dependent hydrolase (beta-lactamase superfamily II)
MKTILKLFVLILIGTAYVSSFSSPCFNRDNVLPIPERSKSPLKAGEEFYVGKIAEGESPDEGVFWATNGGYIFLFAVHETGIIVVDAPPGFSFKAVRATSNKPISHFIYSHIHTDHIQDAYQFDTGKTIFIGSRPTKDYLTARSKENLEHPNPIPNITFKDNYAFEVGRYKFELTAKGGRAHVEGNTLIYLPNQKVLIGIDLVFPRWSPFSRLGEMEDIDEYSNDLDELLSYDFDYYIGGHLGRLGDKADVEEAKQFFFSLLKIAEKTGELPADDYMKLMEKDGNFWLFLRTWYDDMACNCAKELIDRWGGILAAIDVYAESHCYLIQEHLRIGANPLKRVERVTPYKRKTRIRSFLNLNNNIN